ncbi:hypothetical protein F5890DRAFT_1555403 [Lentinula detonsa]|uniref:Uncharacterized protein n=1 Tax=Lentinula detonsa TaxID=2804962 RepID=A0AA38PX98_9AGAR|nr:hypothetical protein F5890DRAFT_1555403 [Lentinula detonsa]
MAGQDNWDYSYNRPGRYPTGYNPNLPLGMVQRADHGQQHPNVPHGQYNFRQSNVDPRNFAGYAPYHSVLTPVNASNAGFGATPREGMSNPPAFEPRTSNTQDVWQARGRTRDRAGWRGPAFEQTPATTTDGHRGLRLSAVEPRTSTTQNVQARGRTRDRAGWRGPAFEQTHPTTTGGHMGLSGYDVRQSHGFVGGNHWTTSELERAQGYMRASAEPPSYTHTLHEGPAHPHGWSPASAQPFGMQAPQQRWRTYPTLPAEPQRLPGMPIAIPGAAVGQRHAHFDDETTTQAGSDHQSNTSKRSSDENKYVVGNLSIGSGSGSASSKSELNAPVPFFMQKTSAHGLQQCPLCLKPLLSGDARSHEDVCPVRKAKKRRGGNKSGDDKRKGKDEGESSEDKGKGKEKAK